MRRRRPRKQNPTGLLLIDKPAGLSSMDVVRRVRRAARGVKTGHAGTLDPLATGLILCCLGRATREVERLMGLPKTYEAWIDLTAFTSTDDREGEPRPVEIPASPDEEAVRQACGGFLGQIEQTPPAHSAARVAGRRAYQLARQGQDVPLSPRTVRIDAIDILGFEFPHLHLRITCGRGTYIRSLARDLGQALHTGGHLADLRRMAVGPYHVENAIPLDQCPERLTEAHLLPADDRPPWPANAQLPDTS